MVWLCWLFIELPVSGTPKLKPVAARQAVTPHAFG